MKVEGLDSATEIEKITRNILIGSKAFGKFPTPVDDIIHHAELTLAQGVSLHRITTDLLSASAHFFGNISRKVLGMIDLREKTIYLDESQAVPRKNFIKLHEVGHDVLPWQRKLLGCRDDETTIVPEVDELYEREASFFASAGLFQLERFEEEASKLPLSIRSARTLAQKFGGSVQASLRRYVEQSPKRCALIVLHKPERTLPFRAAIRNYFESRSFRKEFGELVWPGVCGEEFEFIKDIQRRRRDHEEGQIAMTTPALKYQTFQYHFFDNSYNVFILLFPPGEKVASRVRIVMATS